MKSLFDITNHRYSQIAMELEGEADRALKPIFDKYVKMSFSPREISHIMNLSASNLECEAILTKES